MQHFLWKKKQTSSSTEAKIFEESMWPANHWGLICQQKHCALRLITVSEAFTIIWMKDILATNHEPKLILELKNGLFSAPTQVCYIRMCQKRRVADTHISSDWQFYRKICEDLSPKIICGENIFQIILTAYQMSLSFHALGFHGSWHTLA